jgi:uncharacterized protein YraI
MTFLNWSARRSAFAGLAALLAASFALATPLRAAAGDARPNGYPVTNVNLRAGPDTDYPVITVVPARSWISIRGCLGDYTWCDVSFEGNRGWMRSIYLQGWYQGYYYALRDYAPRLGYPVVSFDIGPYWDSNYHDRPFYAERAKWGGSYGGGSYGEGSTDRGAFYGRLAPYGSWIWLQGQYVWVPRGVGPAWRPYTLGRWVFTDRYGWMWVSNEPFGWATYHYGRWGFSNQVGWFWVPGNRWAPAWVSWRSSDDYLAWAPLPPTPDEGLSVNISVGNVPDYYWQVVPNRDFLAPDLPSRIVVDRDRYSPILQETRPLGNVTVVNNTVVNNVVNINYVEEKTKEKVVVHKVEETKDENEAKSGKVKGDAVEVFQPAPEVKPAVITPAETKPIDEVAAESKTKEQGKGAAATDKMLIPAEVEKPLDAEAKPPAPPPPAAAASEGAAKEQAKEDKSPPPPPPPPPPAAAGGTQPSATGKTEEVTPAPGTLPSAPVEDSGAKGKGKDKKNMSPEENGPPPPPPLEGTAPQVSPPPSAGETTPNGKKEGKQKKEMESQPGGPPPPPLEGTAPQVLPAPSAGETTPNGKKEGKQKKEMESQPGGPPPPPLEGTAPQVLPPPSAGETAPNGKKEGKQKKEMESQPGGPPPPPLEGTAPQVLPPPSAGETAPNGKKEGKQKKEMQPEEGAPPGFAPPPPQGGMAPPSQPMSGGEAPNLQKNDKPKKKKQGQCPDGMVAAEGGNCVPAR